jgi:hypothetical protein
MKRFSLAVFLILSTVLWAESDKTSLQLVEPAGGGGGGGGPWKHKEKKPPHKQLVFGKI